MSLRVKEIHLVLEEVDVSNVSNLEMARRTISLPESLLNKIQDQAIQNKRNNLPNKSVSAIVRTALENHMK